MEHIKLTKFKSLKKEMRSNKTSAESVDRCKLLKKRHSGGDTEINPSQNHNLTLSSKKKSIQSS